MKYDFPKDFIWGVATAAQQIEGGMTEGGRGLSNWDVFSRIPGKINGGGLPDVACDSYHLYETDVALMKKLGVKSYRFSFSWPRIIPDGSGEVNPEGIAYYKKLIACLKANGIVPNATMFHWDLPYALQVQGGFGNRDMVKWFTRYAEVLLDNFGSDVDYWATFNEPIATYVGNAEGFFAPGLNNEAYARQCIHNLLVCHGEAVKLFRKKNFANAKIGIVVDVWKHYPARPDNAEDIASAEFNNEVAGYGMFLHPLFLGGYSERLMRHMRDEGIILRMEPGDYETIRQKVDYYGLNFYNGLYDNVEEERRKKEAPKEGGNYQDRPEVHTEVLVDVLHMLKEQYKIDVPIIITENGMPQTDTPDIASLLDDQERIDYIKGVLKPLHQAMEEGIDVRGYYLWSLMDNFEWSAGYEARFGIHYTNYETLERIPKKSAHWYAKVIAENGFED